MRSRVEDSIDAVLHEACISGALPGVVAMAADAGGVFYEGAFGSADLSTAAPMRIDAVFRIASMTKALTAAAAMQLVERGLLSLDAPARSVLPFLADTQVLDGFDPAGRPILRAPRGTVTLRHLLTHTAGYAYNTWNDALARYQSATGLPLVGSGRLDALTAPLVFDPGTRWEYGIGMDLAGRMVEVASGLDLATYLDRHLLGPLGMVDTGYDARPDWLPRRPRIHERRPDGALQPIDVPPDLSAERSFVTGGNGLHATAADYLRFLRALMNGGHLDGIRILEAETVATMARNQIGPLTIEPLRTRLPERSHDLDLLPGIPTAWGLSFLINTEPVPNGRGAGSLFWAGVHNTYFWIDLRRRISAVFLAQVRPFADPATLVAFSAFERAIYARPGGLGPCDRDGSIRQRAKNHAPAAAEAGHRPHR